LLGVAVGSLVRVADAGATCRKGVPTEHQQNGKHEFHCFLPWLARNSLALFERIASSTAVIMPN
jgi:hypothetical protein